MLKVALGLPALVLGLAVTVGWAGWSQFDWLLAQLLRLQGLRQAGPGLYLRSSYLAQLEAWQPGEEDVLVVGFPRSGTHLATQLTLQALGRSEYASLHHAATFLDFEAIQPDLCGDPRLKWLANYRAGPAPWVHASHLPVSVLRPPQGRYVVVVRAPLDAMSSMYTLLRQQLGPNAPSMAGLLRGSFIRPELGWAQFVLEWWRAHQERPDRVMLLFYEDLVLDLPGQVTRVAEFLGRPLDQAAAERVAARCSLEYMKQHADVFQFPQGCGDHEADIQLAGQIVDTGGAGRGVQSVPEQLRQALWQEYHRVLNGTGFPVDRYSGLFDV